MSQDAAVTARLPNMASSAGGTVRPSSSVESGLSSKWRTPISANAVRTGQHDCEHGFVSLGLGERLK